MKYLRIAAALILATILAAAFAASASVPSVNSIIINPNPPFQSSIWTDKSNYAIGEKVTIGFRVTKDSYAYVFSIDAQGIVRMIFPNIYSTDNKVKANQSNYLPDNSRYNFTIGGPAGTDQLVLVSTPSKIKDTEWLRSSLERNSFAPQININIAADGFLAEIRSIYITPVFKGDWASAYTSYTVGGWGSVPVPPVVTPPVVTPPVIVPPVMTPPVSSQGRINVTSSPGGARVFINGIEQGTTPVNVSGVGFGDYEVTVINPGYYTYTRTVNVTGPSTQQVHAQLVPVKTGASLGNLVMAKQIDISSSRLGPFSESFSYMGSAGSVTVRTESIFGLISRVYATAAASGYSQAAIADFTATGPNAAFNGKVAEYVLRPFAYRVSVLDIRNSSGALTGTVYIDSIKLYLEVYYIG